MKPIFRADDGTLFDTAEECLAHEQYLDRRSWEQCQLLNRGCQFFTSKGSRFILDTHFKESEIYGIHIPEGAYSPDEWDEVQQAFDDHFDNLKYALASSDFGINGCVILVYDWTDNCVGWTEIDYDKKEFLCFVKKVMGWG